MLQRGCLWAEDPDVGLGFDHLARHLDCPDRGRRDGDGEVLRARSNGPRPPLAPRARGENRLFGEPAECHQCVGRDWRGEWDWFRRSRRELLAFWWRCASTGAVPQWRGVDALHHDEGKRRWCPRRVPSGLRCVTVCSPDRSTISSLSQRALKSHAPDATFAQAHRNAPYPTF